MDFNRIIVETYVQKEVDVTWRVFHDVDHMTNWLYEVDQWKVVAVANDLRVGGQLTYQLKKADDTVFFEFIGTYDVVDVMQRVTFFLLNERHVEILFEQASVGTRITVKFDPDADFPIDDQRYGWRRVLNSFKQYIETL